MKEVEERVLDVIEREVLTPEFVAKILTTLPKTEDDRANLASEVETLSAKVENLTNAIEDGGDIPSLVARLRASTKALADAKRLLASTAEDKPSEELRAALEQKIENWRDVLRRKHPQQARAVVAKLIGPIDCGPASSRSRSKPAARRSAVEGRRTSQSKTRSSGVQ